MNASSGSTLAGFDQGTGTTDGDGEAGTVKPPSKLHVCSREYCPLRKLVPEQTQEIVAVCSDMWGLVGDIATHGGSEQSVARLRKTDVEAN